MKKGGRAAVKLVSQDNLGAPKIKGFKICISIVLRNLIPNVISNAQSKKHSISRFHEYKKLISKKVIKQF